MLHPHSLPQFLQEIRHLKRLWLLSLLPVSLLLLGISQNSAFAEWYALHPYVFLSKIGNWLTGLVPFSIGEILLFSSVICLLPVCIIWAIRILRQKGRRPSVFWKGLVNLFCILSLLFCMFTLNCGINYNRLTFAQTSGLELQPSSTQELSRLCEFLSGKLGEIRPLLAEDENGCMKSGFSSLQEKGEAARLAFETLHTEYPLLTEGYSNPKPVLASRWMSWLNITGIYFPFTWEANVNTDVPAYSIPSTMCHELSHLRGFMREDEANFIGYLACCRSESLEFQYSGYTLAFVYANNALFSVDAKEASRIYSTIPEGTKRDFAQNSAYWKQFEGPVEEFSSSVNNAYLQANGQEDGVKSYGRVVDLLLAEQRQRENLT